MSNVNQRLNGLDVFAYMGTNAFQPTDFRTQSFDPGPNDSRNFYLGTWWLNTSTLALWYLASLSGGVATWERVTLNGASTFEGNSGGIVSPDATGLLHVVGDGVTATVVGTPGTHTLTVSVIGGVAADSFPTNSGTATPLAGVLNIFGGNGMTTSGTGNTVTVTSTATFPTDAGTATPTVGGALTIHGGTGITTSGSGSTVTINNTATSSVAIQVIGTTGTYTPTAGMQYVIIEVVGGGGGGGGVPSGSGQFAASGGGASGGYSRGVFTAAAIGASQAVTIGAGGAGGAAGSNDGVPGGNTSVGALISAAGGNAGFHGALVNTAGYTLGGNIPGFGTGGSVNTSGGCGGNGFVAVISTNAIVSPGKGGSSVYGGSGGSSGASGPTSGTGFGAGGASNNYGGGGGGAFSFNDTGAGAAGGVGWQGVAIFTEYI